MPQPIVARFGPFTKGVNALVEASVMDASIPTDALNVQLSRGVLEASMGLGASLTSVSVPTTSTFIAYAGKNAWVYSDYPQFACGDAGTTYYTQRSDALGTSASYPMVRKGASSYRLGVAAPTAAPTSVTKVAGGINVLPSGRYYFKIAYGNSPLSSSAVVSNLSPIYGSYIDHTYDGGVYQFSVAAPVSTQAGFTNTYVYVATDPAGPWYFAGSGTGATISASFNSWPPSYSSLIASSIQIANWGAGGSGASSSTPYDHSPAPNLTVMANQLHTVSSGAGGAGAGILFGAVDNVVWWSELGQPHYWPTANNIAMPDTVEAIITLSAQTFIFTRSAIYSFSGVDDEGLSLANTESGFGVLENAGRTAVRTPHGILFVADDGLALFDGTRAQIISSAFLPDDYFRDFTNMSAAWWDNSYLLFHGTGTIVFDMTTWPEIRMLPNSYVVSAATVTPWADVNYSQSPGLHVFLKDDTLGAVRPWGTAAAGSIYGMGTNAALYAGVRNGSGYVNGAIAVSKFNLSTGYPTGIVVLSNGDVLVADTLNHVIRKISLGVVSDWTLKGDGATYQVGLIRTSTKLAYPTALALDAAGNLYVSDGNAGTCSRITKFDTSGNSSRYAGQVATAGSLNGDRLTTATLQNVYSMALDTAGNLYFTNDTSPFTIRRVVVATGQVETYLTYSNIAGRAAGAFRPFSVHVDRTNDYLYLTDNPNNGSTLYLFKVSPAKVVTQLGTYALASAATYGMTMDSTGNLYMSTRGDTFQKVLKFSNGAFSIFWGSGSTSADGTVPGGGSFSAPAGLAFDASTGTLWAVDNGAHIVNRVAGTLIASGYWSYSTSDFTAGEPSRLKDFGRFRLFGSGGLNIGVYVDDVLVTNLSTSGWLPQCMGNRLRLDVTSPDGSGVVKLIEVEGNLYDGT